MTANRVALRGAYLAERAEARRAFTSGHAARGWHHLERAHVLAQPLAVAHVGSHLTMLRRAAMERDMTEVFGQVIRSVLAGPASLTGRIPTGNDGRARTPLSTTMPIPEDLAGVLGPSP